MKVKSIVIVLEPDDKDPSELDFCDMKFDGTENTWTANGPFYSRFGAMAHEIFKVVKSYAQTGTKA